MAENSHCLQPYMFEPKREAISSDDSSSDDSSEEDDTTITDCSRVGQTTWWSCGMCLPMTTVHESICCQEIDSLNAKFDSKNLKFI